MIIESRGVSRRRVALARLIATAGKALLVAGMVVLGPVLAMDPGDRFVGPSYGAAITFGFLALAASYAVSLTETWSPGTVRVTGDALSIRGRDVPLHAIASAYVVERAVGGIATSVVEIVLANGDAIALRVSDPSVARQLVAALGFGPAGRPTRIDLARPTRRLLHPLLGAGALVLGLVVAGVAASIVAGTQPAQSALFGGVLYVVMAIASGLVYAAFKRLSAAPVVLVGSDAVVIEQALRRTYVARADLARSGDVVPGGGVAHDAERRAAALAMIAERFGPGAERPASAARFERASRDLASWRAHLRGVLDAGYRAAGASTEDAAAVLASAGATDEQRIGAALALRIAGEPADRIRVSAEAAVEPRLRVALAAIADDADDAEVDRALAAWSEERR